MRTLMRDFFGVALPPGRLEGDWRCDVVVLPGLRTGFLFVFTNGAFSRLRSRCWVATPLRDYTAKLR